MTSLKNNTDLAEGGFSQEEAKLIAQKMKVSFDKEGFSLQEFCHGLNDELEHKDVTKRKALATAKLVLAHLRKDPKYYTKVDEVVKSIGIPEQLDIQHEYAFHTTEYFIPRFWYRDPIGNYWAYTNAPEDHPDYDFHLGEALLDINQPLPHVNLEFFTEDGLKRNVAVPQDQEVTKNPNYSNTDLNNIWFEYYNGVDKEVRFVYLDSDVKENPFLWIQQQMRTVDANLTNLRQYAVSLFNQQHPKYKHVGALMMLVDQGMFDIDTLVNAEVGDLSFTDKTVTLLGRRFVADDPFIDYLTSITVNRDSNEPLFEVETVYGRYAISKQFLCSTFYGVFVSPVFLRYWQANHVFSRIMHRIALQKLPVQQALAQALNELANVLALAVDVRSYVDKRLLDTLSENYEANTVSKALPVLGTDGTVIVDSTLSDKKTDEKEFSDWLHKQPMHPLSVQDEQALEAARETNQGAEQEESADAAEVSQNEQ